MQPLYVKKKKTYGFIINTPSYGKKIFKKKVKQLCHQKIYCDRKQSRI